jgi:hypothetical protein
MPKFVHIVQVHPVENGEPNLHKVKEEFEFETEEKAKEFIAEFNEFQRHWINEVRKPEPVKAVYLGCVNDATGELV